MRGVLAAGHPLTAEAGASVLREGGNAVDAAICAVLASCAVESPLTGLGAGGYMLVHDPRGGGESQNVLIDFFVAAPGRGGLERGGELIPVDVHFDSTTSQVFNVGAASCGVPGTPAGLADAHRRFGSLPLAELVRPGVRLAREGAPLNAQQAYVLRILTPIYTALEAARAVYAPAGRILAEGEILRMPDLADALERFGAEGPEPFYRGDIAAAVADFVTERGGILSREDLATYEPIERQPAGATYRGHRVLTNPPPSSGGILIAYCLELLDRMEAGEEATFAGLGGGGADGSDLEQIIAVMKVANEARDPEFIASLCEPGFLESFLDPGRLDRFGSTTHLVAVDGDGMCATVTCSNGTGSGILVPGTGVHLNNMMGEEDLNPLGFHITEPGARMPSMMSPTVVLREGKLFAGLGSAGSNRIRSAVLQTVIGLVGRGLDPVAAVRAPRVHFEGGQVQAEPGLDEAALGRLEAAGVPVTRWSEQNLFFGGVQAVARDAGGGWAGAADPRRGGAVAIA